ncbi:hypothetical protein L596_006299 [Steinernema carpocapsae]|uniref:Uncharacterized protein n=1 Tax=Steinernema carpocapsae TaxID=34508 RepID=A0A4U8V1Q9_STECR|nr:hypothetical protein L596_006299 [Steinernema carpocapsae]
MLNNFRVDDKVPNRYRCCYNRFHVLVVSKVIAAFHCVAFTTGLLCFLPQSIYLFPVIVLVFFTAFHGFRTENPRPLLALQIYLGFLIFADVMFGISVFAVSMMNYDTFLEFIGHVKAESLLVKVCLVLSTKIIIAMLCALCYWHFSVIKSCRTYFREQRDQKNYVQLAVPDSFLNTAIEERVQIAPSVPKLKPDYLVFQLE